MAQTPTRKSGILYVPGIKGKVRVQLRELERRSLVVRRTDPQGRRPDIIVLRDLGDGEPYDDPTGKDGGYVTIHGAVISSANFRRWGAPEVAAYLCAMTADRFARNRHPQRKEPRHVGSATWFRQADWFNMENPLVSRPPGHVAYPFSTKTIERGLRRLRAEGLIEARAAHAAGHPRSQPPQSGPSPRSCGGPTPGAAWRACRPPPRQMTPQASSSYNCEQRIVHFSWALTPVAGGGVGADESRLLDQERLYIENARSGRSGPAFGRASEGSRADAARGVERLFCRWLRVTWSVCDMETDTEDRVLECL